MKADNALALAFEPSLILVGQRLAPDRWQRDLLLAREQFLLLNCSRQSGKSTTVAALAMHHLLLDDKALILLVAPSERQSHELFRKVLDAYGALGRPLAARRENAGELELENGGRVVALPGKEGTIRAFSGVTLLLIDEAARVPDDLYRSVRPMLAVSQGRLIALSTPFGRRGWFHQEWMSTGPWRRFEVPWQRCPRIRPEFIAEERRALGEAWVQQEYECLFTALCGLVYPDFPKACVADQAVPEGRRVGGIDFGWRNPFAAVWGVLDKDDVLWLTGERYLRGTPLSEHAQALPRDVQWYADPAGRGEIEELRLRNLKVIPGDNALARGIALVTARMRSGGLKVLPACANLIAEAQLYRYPTESERILHGENPIDDHNHALAALRYLIARIDARPKANRIETPAPLAPPRPYDPADDDSLWMPL